MVECVQIGDQDSEDCSAEERDDQISNYIVKIVGGNIDSACWSQSISIVEQYWNVYEERFGSTENKLTGWIVDVGSVILKMSDSTREMDTRKIG